MKTVFAFVGSTLGCGWGWGTGPLPIRPYKEILADRVEVNGTVIEEGWKDATGTRIWRDFTAPSNYTSGSLVNGKFKCFACAGLKSDCISDQARHLAEMTDPEKKYDATENWGITGYCETNYACFHQELTTVEAQAPGKPVTDINFDDKKVLVRTGCLQDTDYKSWGIVDECMDFGIEYDKENFQKNGLKNLYNYDLANQDGGPYGRKRAHVTRLCIQTFIGRLEGDGKKCEDQNNAPGTEINENGDEVSCAKYVPASFSNWELKPSEFRPNGW